MTDVEKDEYWRLVALWKFYLDLVVKVNLFFVAIASGVLAYLLDSYSENFEVTRFALWPLILLSGGFTVMAGAGVRQSRELSQAMMSLASRVSIERPVHSHLLILAMALTSMFYLLVTFGLVLLYFFDLSLTS
ncbi:hypothetical protein [Cognatiyoonia sp. IB215182]|uniref:hypothetical protein n=1 Tax=Cognatiyoonia sp. IB215182 TaxID=3097353 RepID=UPI002A146BC3|nr:hypothetical protein [Cognatiyoonia sp. IB215182]MDX8354349.1 hypothetical protein [Cognatiyoonia sp. IB215182]